MSPHTTCGARRRSGVPRCKQTQYECVECQAAPLSCPPRPELTSAGGHVGAGAGWGCGGLRIGSTGEWRGGIFKYLHIYERSHTHSLSRQQTTHKVATPNKYTNGDATKHKHNTHSHRIVNSWNSFPENILNAKFTAGFKNRYDKQKQMNVEAGNRIYIVHM